MKGICHIWSRGRHFSPSLPGDRYLNLAPKATSGQKSWGASFGTTLWHHVQRYCACFFVFMLILCVLTHAQVFENCSCYHGRQSWKTSAHAYGWLSLAHFRSFDQWKVSTLNDVVHVGDSLAITTFDKIELDEFWEQSNSTRSLWHTELISRECWLFSNSKAGKSWEALLDSHSATGWVDLSDVQSTLLEQD